MDQQQFRQFGGDQPARQTTVVKRNTKPLVIVLTVMTLLLLLAISAAVYFYYQSTKKVEPVLTTPASQAEEIAALVKKVSEIMLLPVDETPQVVTVTDLKAVSDQAFFKNAKLGDKVIVYTKAKRGILYRPSEHKVIEAAPVALPAEEEATQPAPSSTSTTKPSATTGNDNFIQGR